MAAPPGWKRNSGIPRWCPRLGVCSKRHGRTSVIVGCSAAAGPSYRGIFASISFKHGARRLVFFFVEHAILVVVGRTKNIPQITVGICFVTVDTAIAVDV